MSSIYWTSQHVGISKGQLISKANCQAVNSSKKNRMNEFVFTSMQRVFHRFFEEIEDSKKVFRNYLTFSWHVQMAQFFTHPPNAYEEAKLGF